MCLVVLAVCVPELFNQTGASEHPLLGVIAAVSILGFGILMVYSGQRLGTREIPFLTEHLCRTLDAVEMAYAARR